MANPARKISDEGIDSLIASQALNELFRREHQSREDRGSIWLVIVMMIMVFLILVLFEIEVLISKPKNEHPIESAWYRHALPLFKIVSRDRPSSVLPPTQTTVTLLPFTKPWLV
jgi:hypothetical protein